MPTAEGRAGSQRIWPTGTKKGCALGRGNICRCGAYTNIVAAIREAAGRGA
jgi:hypothetical protein